MSQKDRRIIALVLLGFCLLGAGVLGAGYLAVRVLSPGSFITEPRWGGFCSEGWDTLRLAVDDPARLDELTVMLGYDPVEEVVQYLRTTRADDFPPDLTADLLRLQRRASSSPAWPLDVPRPFHGVERSLTRIEFEYIDGTCSTLHKNMFSRPITGFNWPPPMPELTVSGAGEQVEPPPNWDYDFLRSAIDNGRRVNSLSRYVDGNVAPVTLRC